MPVSIKVTSDIDKVVARMAKQFQQAAANATQRAVTKTAFRVKKAEEQEIAKVFDRPTPYTLKSVRIFYKRREIVATVWLKDELDAGKGTPATKYLAPQIAGGDRETKRFEAALQRVGVMPRGWFAVPGEGADIDAYGNMVRSQFVKILSWFRAFGEQGYSANMTRATRAKRMRGTRKKRGEAYFAVLPGGRNSHLHPGIYRRTGFGVLGSAIKPILIFVKAVRFSKKLDFYRVANREVELHFADEMQRALSIEMGKVR